MANISSIIASPHKNDNGTNKAKIHIYLIKTNVLGCFFMGIFHFCLSQIFLNFPHSYSVRHLETATGKRHLFLEIRHCNVKISLYFCGRFPRFHGLSIVMTDTRIIRAARYVAQL